jgi:hypothetical protein
MENKVLASIDTLIEIIEGQKPETEMPRVSTRDEMIGMHYAFLKSIFLLTEPSK